MTRKIRKINPRKKRVRILNSNKFKLKEILKQVKNIKCCKDLPLTVTTELTLIEISIKFALLHWPILRRNNGYFIQKS